MRITGGMDFSTPKLRIANAKESESGLDAMYSALRLMRESGETARLRARLSPRTLEPKQIEALESELYGSWVAQLKENTESLGSVVSLPGDLLSPTGTSAIADYHSSPTKWVSSTALETSPSVVRVPSNMTNSGLEKRSRYQTTTITTTTFKGGKPMYNTRLKEIKKQIYATYLEGPRDQKLRAMLRAMVENVSDCFDGGGSRQRALFLIGNSGSGKTFSLKHHFALIQEFQPFQNEYGETVSPF